MMRKYLPIILASLVSITALSASYFQKTGLIVQPTVTTTSAGTLTLVATSNQVHVFTGSTTHNLTLPDATLLYSGWFFEVSNDSTATVTIAQSDLSTLFQLASSTWAKIWLTSNASATGNWKYKTSGSATGGGTPGGADTEVQFNDGGAFGGESTFTYDKTNNRLSSEEITSSGGGSGATSERFGSGVDGSGANQVVVGASADCSSGADSICIGKSVAASTGQRSIYIGSGAQGDTVGFNAFVGYGTSGSNASASLGNAAVCHSDSVCLGSGATANDTATGKNIAIGKNANISSGVSRSIAIGEGAAITTGTNIAVIGSSDSPINNIYLGENVVTTGPSPVTLQASGASGTDVSGSTFTIASSKGTGNASPPTLVFNVATPNSVSGTSLQSLAERFRVGRTVEYPQEIVKPAAPAAGYTSLYAKNDGNLYQQDSAGTETNLASAGGTPAGSTTEIQYNNAGAFGAESALVYFATSNRVGIGTSTPDGPLDVIEFASNDAVYLTLPNATPNSATLAVKQWSVTLDDAGDTFEFIGKDGLGNVVQRSLGASGGGSGEALEKSVTQASHGFAVGDVVYFDGSTYELAEADVDATSEVLGVVNAVADVNNFTLTMAGYISGLSGLIAGTTYYLSASSAGDITATEPSGAGEVSKPVLVAVSTTAAYVLQSRGAVIESGGGGGSVGNDYGMVYGATGFGAVNTKVIQHGNTSSNGTSVTPANSANNGSSLTINADGVYAVSCQSEVSISAQSLIMTVDDTTMAEDTMYPAGAAMFGFFDANSGTQLTSVRYFVNGDVLRCGWTAAGLTLNNNTYHSFIAVRVN